MSHGTPGKPCNCGKFKLIKDLVKNAQTRPQVRTASTTVKAVGRPAPPKR